MVPEHQTPFVVGSAVLPDREGVEQLILLLKATYDVSPAGNLAIAEEQEPLCPCDELRGEPERSSIAREAEVGPPKPLGTDLFLTGHAVAPKVGTRQLGVRLRVGAVDKQATVFGPRVWRDGALGAGPSEAEPFERVPLIWENAFGGEDKSADAPVDWEGEPRNPVGRGFRARKSRVEWRAAALPQIERPDSLLSKPGDRPAPVGFGPIGRHWQPRLGFAGTYDERWMRERAPLLALDFDERFHHAAPPDQVIEGHVRGGEMVEVAGCTPEGLLRFALPVVRPQAWVRMFSREVTLELKCDAVCVDTDCGEVRLVYKAALAVPGVLREVRTVGIFLEGEES